MPMTQPHPHQSLLRTYGGRFLRGLALLVIGIGMGFGLMTEVKPGHGAYDPDLFAIGVSGLLALACTFIAYLFFRNYIICRRKIPSLHFISQGQPDARLA